MLASGLAFGMAVVPVVDVSSTAGSVAAFLLTRHLFQPQARRLLARHRLSGATLRAFDLEGWRVLALMRFYGPLPTMVCRTTSFAISRISLWSFTLITLVFSLPQIIFYVYLGSLGQVVLRGERPGFVSVIGATCAVCCAVATVALVGNRVRTLLQRGVPERAACASPARGRSVLPCRPRVAPQPRRAGDGTTGR